MTNFVVPPRSWDDIAAITRSVRGTFSLTQVPYFPIMELIERVLDHKLGWLSVCVGTAAEMDGAEGLTDPSGKFIKLREDVYLDAWNGKGRARFTACHELGHWVMHRDVPMARTKPGVKYPAYELAEPQANQFAGELSMPRE